MSDDERETLAEPFEQARAHLRAVAFRMLGSHSEADDAVQEAWLRLSRSGGAGVENLRGWLTTVVARVCLDMLRSRKSRREEELGTDEPEADSHVEEPIDPEQQALLADAVGPALLVVLETLAPPERVAFVLHDMFDLSFDEIAPIVGRSATAARQLASRARRRVQGAPADREAARGRDREVVNAFLAASRGGDFAALLSLLDPEVVLRADAAALQSGAVGDLRGADAVARNFVGRARAARAALVDGAPAAVWAPGGQPRVVFAFTITDGKIVAIDLLADPERLRGFEVEILDD
jgi:RNA polymerase sigma factor (sigma-70 family)